MGMAVSAVAAAMFTLAALTAGTAQTQRQQSTLMSATESLKATGYRPCGESPAPSETHYQADYDGDDTAWRPDADSGVTVRITSVEYWNGAGAGGLGEFRPTCPSGADQGRQRLTIRVDGPGWTPRTASVVIAEEQWTEPEP